MDRDEATVRAFSRVSAVVSFLGGAAIIGVLVLLVTFFSSRGFVAEVLNGFADPLFALLVLSGIAGMVLAPFIWRQQFWAMLVALVLSGTFLFLFGNETEMLKYSLAGATALFVVCAGVRFWLAPAAAS
jgi:hypothetical protein